MEFNFSMQEQDLAAVINNMTLLMNCSQVIPDDAKKVDKTMLDLVCEQAEALAMWSMAMSEALRKANKRRSYEPSAMFFTDDELHRGYWVRISKYDEKLIPVTYGKTTTNL